MLLNDYKKIKKRLKKKKMRITKKAKFENYQLKVEPIKK